MAVLNKDDFMKRIQERIGDDTSDDAMTFIEDMTDTFNDFETRSSGSDEWKQKYDDLDKSWREKYKARFFEGSTVGGTTPDDALASQTSDVQDDGEEKTFEDLFTEREG